VCPRVFLAIWRGSGTSQGDDPSDGARLDRHAGGVRVERARRLTVIAAMTDWVALQSDARPASMRVGSRAFRAAIRMSYVSGASRSRSAPPLASSGEHIDMLTSCARCASCHTLTHWGSGDRHAHV